MLGPCLSRGKTYTKRRSPSKASSGFIFVVEFGGGNGSKGQNKSIFGEDEQSVPPYLALVTHNTFTAVLTSRFTATRPYRRTACEAMADRVVLRVELYAAMEACDISVSEYQTTAKSLKYS